MLFFIALACAPETPDSLFDEAAARLAEDIDPLSDDEVDCVTPDDLPEDVDDPCAEWLDEGEDVDDADPLDDGREEDCVTPPDLPEDADDPCAEPSEDEEDEASTPQDDGRASTDGRD